MGNGTYDPNHPDNLAGLSVLVVDDSNTIRRSAEKILKQAGCNVILANDGFDALAKVESNRPDVIFLDAVMPRLNGYQICTLLKRNKKLCGIPVIMLSSLDTEDDRTRGAEAGSDEYLTKPFTKEILLRAVEFHGTQRATLPDPETRH